MAMQYEDALPRAWWLWLFDTGYVEIITGRAIV